MTDARAIAGGIVDARCNRVPGWARASGGGLAAPRPDVRDTLDAAIAARLDALDRAGVRVQVLCPPAPPPVAALDGAARSAWIAQANDAMRAVTACAPGRLEGFASIDFDDDTQGVGALDAATQQGFCGASIATAHRGERLDEDRFRPFLARAAELRFPLLVHSDALQGSGPSVGERQQRHVGVYGDLGICLGRLLFRRVFEDLPGLTLCFADGGGIIAGLVARLDHGYDVRKECRALLPKAPSSYLRQVYIDGSGIDPGLLEATTRLVGSTQVMFASGDDDLATVKARVEAAVAALDAARPGYRERFLHGNARQLYARLHAC